MARPKSFRRYPKCGRCRRSAQVIGYGTRRNQRGTKQLWYCTTCEYKFCLGDERHKLDDPGQEADLAAMALWLRFHALSARAIRSFFHEFYHLSFSRRGLSKWLHRQINALMRYLYRKVHVFKLGRIWHADELFVRARRQAKFSQWAYFKI